MKTKANTILITGGTSGIGRAMAERWHAAGNHVVVVGRRAALIDELVSAYPGMSGYAVDMADAAGLAAFGARVVQEHPGLNVVVHNAGIMEVEDLASGDWLDIAERTVTTNLLAPMRLTAALLPHLRSAANAAIVTVSSGLAFVPLTKTPAYSATKAALHSWSVSLRHELAADGIEVIEIAPPAVQTDLMPGHASNPDILTLPAFIDETMALLGQIPTPAEILVQKVMFLRAAEREERFQAAFDAVNPRG